MTRGSILEYLQVMRADGPVLFP